MTFAPDNNVIVQSNAKQTPGFGNLLRDLNIRAAWLWAAAGVIVDEDQRGGADIHRSPDHLSRVDCRLVNRAVTDSGFCLQCVKGRACLLWEKSRAWCSMLCD